MHALMAILHSGICLCGTVTRWTAALHDVSAELKCYTCRVVMSHTYGP